MVKSRSYSPLRYAPWCFREPGCPESLRRDLRVAQREEPELQQAERVVEHGGGVGLVPRLPQRRAQALQIRGPLFPRGVETGGLLRLP